MTEQNPSTGRDPTEVRKIGGMGGAGEQDGGATEDQEGEQRPDLVVARRTSLGLPWKLRAAQPAGRLLTLRRDPSWTCRSTSGPHLSPGLLAPPTAMRSS